MRLLVLMFALTGCAADIHDLYDEHRSFALAAPDAVPDNWQADASVVLSPELVSTMVEQALNRGLADVKPLSVGRTIKVRPQAKVKSVALVEDSCKDCVAFRARLKGDVTVEAGSIERTVPFDGRLRAAIRFTSEAKGELRIVQAQVAGLDRFVVEVDGPRGVNINLNDVLGDWADSLLAEVPPMNVAELGGEDMPVRDLRLLPSGEGLRVDLLTHATHGSGVKAALPTPESGWVAAVSEDTLLDLARRAAFEHGEISLDVHAEPLYLDLDGGRFEMGLRLWRLSGKGWWRDYKVRGDVIMRGKVVSLVPDDVVEDGKSKGAGLVDPLAALGESLIIKVIEDAATRALPVSQTNKVSGMRLNVTVTGAEGSADALVAVGTATLAATNSASGASRGPRPAGATSPTTKKK